MDFDFFYINKTDSTNRWLRELKEHADRPTGSTVGVVVVADYQTAGKGCGTNSWESEPAKNLLFSILIHPSGIKPSRQFVISMVTALAISEALSNYVEGISIKWPNDIYWNDRKLCGILIENQLSGESISDCIIGVGVNVNQEHFVSDAPNPVSLRQILGRDIDRQTLLDEILEAFKRLLPASDDVIAISGIRQLYLTRLYRRGEFRRYRDKNGEFEARLTTVRDDGTLVLNCHDGRQREYAFKEVQFII